MFVPDGASWFSLIFACKAGICLCLTLRLDTKVVLQIQDLPQKLILGRILWFICLSIRDLEIMFHKIDIKDLHFDTFATKIVAVFNKLENWPLPFTSTIV